VEPADEQMMAALESSNRDLKDRLKQVEESSRRTQDANTAHTKRTEERERHATIRASLADFHFVNDEAREDGFRCLRDQVKRGEDGELYGGDFIPMKDFAKSVISKKTHLLVQSASSRQNAGGTPAVQFEDIHTGMKPAARDAAWEAVREITRKLNE